MSSLVYYFIVWPCNSPLNKIGTVNFYLNGLSEIRSYPVNEIIKEETQFVQLTIPLIIVSKSTEQTESAITFTALSTDSDNTMLSLEKEHCTHETLCSFPSVGI